MTAYIVYGMTAPNLKPGSPGTVCVGAFESPCKAMSWVEEGNVPKEYRYFGVHVSNKACYRVFGSKVLTQAEIVKAAYAYGKIGVIERVSGPYESRDLAEGGVKLLKRSPGVWKSFLVGMDTYQPGEVQ